MNSRSVLALVFYASMMTGLMAVVAQLGAAVARHGASVLLLAERSEQPVSRVERGLEAQARVTDWQPVSHVVELHAYPSSEASAVALASAMDSAEGAGLPKAQPALVPARVAKAVKPRVAGWIKRVARVPLPPVVPETTAHLIQRHLRAEM